jgi:GDP-4-dehydro-6-deoxy-D-mannose reductase
LRILITGASGFAGRHLTQHLLAAVPDVEIYGTTLFPIQDTDHKVTFCKLDLRDDQQVNELIADIHPDAIYHLAAQASVPRSFDAPWETMENNIRAQLNLIEACRREQIRPRILIVSSAEIYDPTHAGAAPITEDTPLRPTSPYGVSKVTQDFLALQYHLSYDLPILRARPFNHIGPGQNEDFVAPAFAMQIARIEVGQQPPILHVGDLSAARDFTDVRDIVRAYHLIVEQGTPGEVYNICSGRARSIQSLLDHLLSLSKAEISVEVDPDRLRPTSIPVLRGDCARLQAATGWKPQIPFEQSLSDILDDCRQQVQP